LGQATSTETGSPLFPDSASQRAAEEQLTTRLSEAQERVRAGQVSPTVDVDAFRQALSSRTFDAPEDLTDLIDWTVAQMEVGLVHMTHPRYFGLFNPAPSYPSICADRIAAVLNPQICVWSHAPVAVDIENHVIRQVCRRAGFPQGSGGHFTSGGSEANNTAVICALTAGNPHFAQDGARAYPGQPRIYVSRESHLAWVKIAHQLGIGRRAVRLVATDGKGQMDAAQLRKAIDADLAAGDVPVIVAATAGTTNAGAVDPLHACADIAHKHGTWFHVDAAWGGALIASPKYATVLDGIERADSITIDAHKWFATTMGAGIYLTRRTSVLNDAFQIATDYMPSNDTAVDFYVNSIQWSRRFIGLRLFLALGAAGWPGYAAHVEQGIHLIKRLTDELVSNGWTLANDSQMAVACLVPPQSAPPVEELVNRIVASGDAWVSLTKFEGRSVLRVCATNGRTTAADIDRLAAQLIALAGSSAQ
jgi:glutamate/tyrosine decarboxylase-like PLP-dependent enzyme